MKKIHLSSSEELLMEIFWQKGTPLSSLELLDLSLESPETSGWGVNYIHKMLTMLQKKNLVEICGFIKEGKRYVRQFCPCLTKEEYIAGLLKQKGVDASSFIKIAMAMVQPADSGDSRLINELEQMLDSFEEEGKEDK